MSQRGVTTALLGKSVFMAAVALATGASAEFVDGEAFGVRMGTPTAALDVGFVSASADPTIRLYALKSVPKPHPLLDTYYVNAGNGAGVCKIHGVFRSDNVDRADRAEKELLNETADSLGPPETRSHPVTDRLVEFWRRALGHSDLGRYPDTYNTYTWKRKGFATRMVRLAREFPSPNTLVRPGKLEHAISFEVEYENFDECIKEAEEMKRR